MAKILNLTGTEASNDLELIKNKTTVDSKVGNSYVYNSETKVIEVSENLSDKAEVYVVARRTASSITLAVPFHVGMTLLNAKGPTEIGSNENLVFEGKLRDYQEIDLQSIVASMLERGCCYFKAFPGYGKTVLISYIISVFKEKSMIVVPNISLAEQTQKSINTMVPRAKVFIMGIDRVIPSDADVVIAFFGRINGTSLPFLEFKTVVFDEVHMLSTPKGIAAMLTLRPSRLFALTATGGERNNITELFVGKAEIEPSVKKSWYIAFPRVKSGLDGSQYTNIDGYTQAIGDLSSSEIYTNTVILMLKYWHYMEKRVIVIAMRKEMRDKIAEMLKDNQEKITYAVLTSENKKCSNADIIIGTHKLIGTGFDLSNSIEDFDGKAASVTVFLGSIKDATLMQQVSGRSFRNESSLAVYISVPEVGIFVKHTEELKATAKQIPGCTILNKYSSFLEHFCEEAENNLLRNK